MLFSIAFVTVSCAHIIETIHSFAHSFLLTYPDLFQQMKARFIDIAFSHLVEWIAGKILSYFF